MIGRIACAVTVCLSLLLGGCSWSGLVAQPYGPPPVPAPTPTATIEHGDHPDSDEFERPGPFRVRYGGVELILHPWTFCYGNACVDGVDPDPPSVGSPESILVYAAPADWDELHVSQREGIKGHNGRTFAAEVEELGRGWWRVTPRGDAGTYRVELFAEGDGDMIATVLWTTPADRPLPPVEANLSLIADRDGRPDSYGLELFASNLASTPKTYSATITVTAAGGESMTIEARPVKKLQKGTVAFRGPDREAKQAARLGEYPFTLRVELVLDGVTHVATATYPDDEIEGYEPYVALEFDPALR